MARALSICLGVLLCSGGAAYGDKPRIAVLGLEVAPGPAGSIDPGAVLIAREVTRELRLRVQAPASPYILALNSSRELLDEKLLNSCDSEALDCMVVIGAGLASDAMLYGRVEKRGDGFRIALKLLDVRRKQLQLAVDDLAGGGGVAGAARRLYRKLIGDGPSSEGSVIVKARSDAGAAVHGGNVIVDDDPRGPLVGGRLLIGGVAEGRHTIAISVAGFHRFEEIVTVRGGEQATVDALLHREPAGALTQAPPDLPAGLAAGARSGLAAGPGAGPGAAGDAQAQLPAQPLPEAPAGRPSPLWKAALGVGATAFVGGGAYAWYSYDRQRAHAALVNADVNASRCGDSDAALMADAGNAQIDIPAFRRACTWTTRTYLGYAIGGLGAATAILSLIVMSRDPSPSDAAGGARGRKSEVAIAPLLAPGTAGAQIALRW